ncbi:hypothetical protein ACN47E_005057 [Coniothyrium glycines]
MDIRAWERRASAEQEHSYQAGEEDYYDDRGELMTAEEYDEMLFRRVLDKIRIARAAGHADVDLTSEEIDAYHAKLHGSRAPAARPVSSHRLSTSPLVNDNASVVSAQTISKHGKSSSRSKKEHRSSLLTSKPKKEKTSSRKRSATLSSATAHASPGFVIPGPDGQPLFTPVNAYQGTLARDREAIHQQETQSPTSDHHDHYDPPRPRRAPLKDVSGAFPGSEDAYYPRTPMRQRRSVASEHAEHIHDDTPPPRLIPFPVEPYQYHNFSPSSSSPTSPLPYIRNVSSTPSEASYKSMPRRVPVPTPAPALMQRTVPMSGHQALPDPVVASQMPTSGASTSTEQVQETVKLTSNGRDTEKRKKSGRSKKKA